MSCCSPLKHFARSSSGAEGGLIGAMIALQCASGLEAIRGPCRWKKGAGGASVECLDVNVEAFPTYAREARALHRVPAQMSKSAAPTSDVHLRQITTIRGFGMSHGAP